MFSDIVLEGSIAALVLLQALVLWNDRAIARDLEAIARKVRSIESLAQDIQLQVHDQRRAIAEMRGTREDPEDPPDYDVA